MFDLNTYIVEMSLEEVFVVSFRSGQTVLIVTNRIIVQSKNEKSKGRDQPKNESSFIQPHVNTNL